MPYQKICYYMDEVDNILKGRTQYPISFEVDPSNRCQNDCKFCMYKTYRNNNPVDLDMNLYLKLLSSLYVCGVKSITFSGGGEPTLHPYFEDLVYHALSRGFEIGLVTNGILLSHINALWDSFKFIRVSLDAATPETYKAIKRVDRFKEIEDAIYSFKADKRTKGTTFGVSFVVCNENTAEIELFKTKYESSADYLQIKPNVLGLSAVRNVESDVTSFTHRFMATSDLPCKIAGLVGIAGADGKVYYCCQKRGDERYVIGDLNKEDFKVMWDRRDSISPDFKSCPPCRYMNYAKEYKKYMSSKYSYLRHRNFL